MGFTDLGSRWLHNGAMLSENDFEGAVGMDLSALDGITKSENQLRLMIDTIPTLAWSCWPDGWTEFLNRGWLDYRGLSTEESVGWGWKTSINPEELGKLMNTWMRLLASGEAGEEEARVRRFDGEYRWFLIRAAPIKDGQGNVIRWCGTNTDIGDLKRAEDQGLALQQELECERDRLRLLLEIHKALVSNLDLPSLFTALAQNLRRVTDCDFIGLALPDPGTGELRQHLVNSSKGCNTT